MDESFWPRASSRPGPDLKRAANDAFGSDETLQMYHLVLRTVSWAASLPSCAKYINKNLVDEVIDGNFTLSPSVRSKDHEDADQAR